MHGQMTVVAALLLALSLHAETVVTGVGRAPGDARTAREQALAEALRDAVRKGVGVDLVAATRVRDYALDYDRVFATAFGYVRDYKILAGGLDEVGDYVVTVTATVGKGAPELEDRLLVRQIIRLKGAPRLAIMGDETLNGAPVRAPAGAGAVAARAVDLGFRVLSSQVARAALARRAARDELLDDRRTAALRRTAAAADVIVSVRTAVEVGAPEAVYGSELRPVSLNLDLAATWADSAEQFARLSPPAVRLSSAGATPEAALAEALKAHLAGGAADAFLRRILARWVAELDLGGVVRLEIRGIDRDRWRGLAAALRDAPGITSVWERDFDARHLSLMDIETRLTAEQLADRLEKTLQGAFRTDKATMAAVSMVPAAPAAATDTTPPPVAARPCAVADRVPRPAVIALAVAALLLAGVGGALLAGKR